jgi:diaminopimelate decarboxylase
MRPAHAWRPRELPPLLHPQLDALIHHAPHTLLDWVTRLGSPLNVMWPDRLRANVQALRSAERRHGLALALYYGAKVNQSQALVKAAVEAGIGVDVSSEHELQDALRAGVSPAQVCATDHRLWQVLREETLAAFDAVAPRVPDAALRQAERAAFVEQPWPTRSLLRMHLARYADYRLQHALPNPLAQAGG